MQVEAYIHGERDENGNVIDVNFGIVDVLVPVKPGPMSDALRKELVKYHLPEPPQGTTHEQGLRLLIGQFQKLVDTDKTRFLDIGAHYVKIALHRRTDWSAWLSYQTLFSGDLREYLGQAQASFGPLQNLVWAHCVGVPEEIYSGGGAPGELEGGFAKVLELGKIDNAEATMAFFANPTMKPTDYREVVKRLEECEKVSQAQGDKLARIRELLPSLSEPDRTALRELL